MIIGLSYERTTMASEDPLAEKLLNDFAASYRSGREAAALQSRGEFLRLFPKNNIKNMKLDEYVIGRGTPTFCAYVEARTKAWAIIQGATAFKFGIYFGCTKSDPEKKYRFAQKFGKSKSEAFGNVRQAVVDLVGAGNRIKPDFNAIDSNPLSQMFKAKILSLYFPDIFLNVCSAEHIELLASVLGIPDRPFTSEYQFLLEQAKLENETTRTWSNPKFMEFLYSEYVRKEKPAPDVQEPRRKGHPKVNFEDIQAMRDSIGKAAEEFALSWERERLCGAGMKDQICRIEDRRDRPSYGYDFLSFSSPESRRLIEVKSVAKIDGVYRFFLSDNERAVSMSDEHQDEYYFYLVLFDGKAKPADLKAVHSKDLYNVAELAVASYAVRFDFP